MLIASGVLFALFFVRERFAAEPILPLGLFRNQVFGVSALLSLVQMMILLGIALYMPFFLQGVLGQSATNSGLTTTSQSVSVVIGSIVSGILISMLKRYRVLSIISSLILALGIFLLTRMDVSTNILTILVAMVLSGLGMGVFFSVLNLTAQNSLPRTRLGVGTAAVKYMGQIGSILGIAVIGSVVNSTVASNIKTRVSASVANQLTPAGWKAATNPQVLTNPDAQRGIISAAQHYATQNIPAGPQHDLILHQIAHTLTQVFDALKLSFTVAIQQGFLVVLLLCAAMIVGSFFLNMEEAAGKPEKVEAGV